MGSEKIPLDPHFFQADSSSSLSRSLCSKPSPGHAPALPCPPCVQDPQGFINSRPQQPSLGIKEEVCRDKSTKTGTAVRHSSWPNERQDNAWKGMEKPHSLTAPRFPRLFSWTSAAAQLNSGAPDLSAYGKSKACTNTWPRNKGSHHFVGNLGVEKEHNPSVLPGMELKTTPNPCLDAASSAIPPTVCASRAHRQLPDHSELRQK